MHLGVGIVTVEDINSSIDYWTNWASIDSNQRYDVALMKIWVQFEKYVASVFVDYCLGRPSENGYLPERKIEFQTETQLNAFLRAENKSYVDYPAQIKKLSKHIFENDPFDIIFLDVNNNVIYENIIAIRNYVAHESAEARKKLIKNIYAGRDENFVEPVDFLMRRERSTNLTYYTYYTKFVSNIAQLLTERIE